MAKGATAHLCLTCSCKIVNCEEEKVKMKFGRFRYRHKFHEDCSDALRHPPLETSITPRRPGRARRPRKYRGNPEPQPVLTPEEFEAQ